MVISILGAFGNATILFKDVFKLFVWPRGFEVRAPASTQLQVWITLFLTLVHSGVAHAAPNKVLIIANDPQITELTDGLSHYPDFGVLTVTTRLANR